MALASAVRPLRKPGADTVRQIPGFFVKKPAIDWDAIPNTLATRRQLAFLRDSFLLDVVVPEKRDASREEREETVRGLYAGRARWWREMFFSGDAELRGLLLVTLLRPRPISRAIAYARRVL